MEHLFLDQEGHLSTLLPEIEVLLPSRHAAIADPLYWMTQLETQ